MMFFVGGGLQNSLHTYQREGGNESWRGVFCHPVRGGSSWRNSRKIIKRAGSRRRRWVVKRALKNLLLAVSPFRRHPPTDRSLERSAESEIRLSEKRLSIDGNEDADEREREEEKRWKEGYFPRRRGEARNP